jgi:nucleoside-diphosphate-sugar epimerase
LKILITGANGFTGRHFAKAARAAGHDVVPLIANLRDKDALAHEVQSVAPETVVHLAAISFVGFADAGAFYQTNVIGTLNLLEALTGLKQSPRSVLLSSSANVYGNCLASPITEVQPPAPVNHYAMSKLAMEYLSRSYAGKLPLFFTRPFNYTGPGQSLSFIIPKLVTHFSERRATVEIGNIDVEREFNDVRFLCEAYLRLVGNVSPGDVVNVCSGEPITLRAVLDLLTKITGHEIEVRINPEFIRVNEIHRLCGDPSKLISVAGHIPTPSLSDTLTWMLSEPSVSNQ